MAVYMILEYSVSTTINACITSEDCRFESEKQYNIIIMFEHNNYTSTLSITQTLLPPLPSSIYS